MADNSLLKQKRCPRCNETKDSNQFNTRWVDGRQYLASKCRPCCADYKREQEQNPVIRARHREIVRRWRKEHADDPVCKAAKKVVARRDYEKNGKSRRRAWIATPEGKQKNIEQCSKYRQEHPYAERSEEYKGKARAACRIGNLRRQHDAEWVAQDKVRNKVWVAANKDRARSYKLAHLSRKRSGNADESIVKENFFECLESYRIGTQYWDVYESRLIDQPSIDHIVPLKAGGSNGVDNLCVTSKANNSAKRESSLLIYMWKRAMKHKL